MLVRDAGRNALTNKIIGDQTISYLNTHAHQYMKKRVIPLNVSDKIRLSEMEQEQEQMVPWISLSKFSTDATVSAHQVHVVHVSCTHLNNLRLLESKLLCNNFIAQHLRFAREIFGARKFLN